MNKIFLIGRIGLIRKGNAKDNDYITISIATNESYKNKETNEKIEKVEWHTCISFAPHHIKYVEYLQKGDLISVVGKMQSHKYSDQNNVEKIAWRVRIEEISKLSTKSNTNTNSDSNTLSMSEDKNNTDFYILDDEIPF